MWALAKVKSALLWNNYVSTLRLRGNMLGGLFGKSEAQQLSERTIRLTSKELENHVFSTAGGYQNKPDVKIQDSATKVAAKYASDKAVRKVGTLRFKGQRCFLLYKGEAIDELLPESARLLSTKTQSDIPVKFEIQLIKSRDGKREWAHIKLMSGTNWP